MKLCKEQNKQLPVDQHSNNLVLFKAMDSKVNCVHFDETPDLYKDANIKPLTMLKDVPRDQKDVNCNQNLRNLSKSSSHESDACSSTQLLDNSLLENGFKIIEEEEEEAINSFKTVPFEVTGNSDDNIWSELDDTLLANVRRKYLKKSKSQRNRKFVKELFENRLSKLLLLIIIATAFIITIIRIITLIDNFDSSNKPFHHSLLDEFNLQSDRWWTSSFFYEVFPASLKDTDHNGFGDFKGIAKSLNYFKSIGVNVVHLNSIFQAHNYPNQYWNVLNFTQIDLHLGNLEHFIKLLNDLHRNGIKLILDINPSVTSYKHPWAIEWIIQQSEYFRYFYVNQTVSDHVHEHAHE